MKTFLHKSAFLFMHLLSLVTTAQTVQLIPNPVATDLGYKTRFALTPFNGKLYGVQIAWISDFDNAVGKLAQYDGATITLIDNPDAAGNNQGVLDNPIVYNANLYFEYKNSNNKNQLAKFDGNSITLLPNPDNGVGFVGEPIVFNNNLYFKYTTENGIAQVAKYDGTTVSLVSNPDTCIAIYNFIIYKNNLYFQFINQDNKNLLARYDGTSISLIPNFDIADEGIQSSNKFIIYKNELYFGYVSASNILFVQLAKFDGSAITLISTPDNNSRGVNGNPIIYNSNLYCVYEDSLNNYQLMKYDGSLVTLYSNPDSGIGYVGTPIVYNGFLYYGYYDSNFTPQLVKFDGLNSNLVPNPSSGVIGGIPTLLNGVLFYLFYNSNGQAQFAKFDGTNFGLIPNPDTASIGVLSSSVMSYNNSLYFIYKNTANNYQLAKLGSNTPAPTGLANTIYTGNEIIANIPVAGTGIKWYASATATTTLNPANQQIDGTTYYATQTIGGIESTDRLQVTVKKIGESSQILCNNTTVADLANTPLVDTKAVWYTNNSGGTILAGNTFLATGTYYVEQNSFASSVVTTGSNPFIGIAVQPDGKIIVCDSNNDKIIRTNADGTNSETLGSGFNFPTGVAIQTDGKILIADSGNNAIKRMDTDGSNITTLANATNGLWAPNGITLQTDGKIIIADTFNNAIKRIDADGSNITTLNSNLGSYAVAVQADGKILVADNNTGTLVRMDTDGLNATTFASGFSKPFGIAVQADGKILVADYGNNALKIMNADGSNLETIITAKPEGIALESDGSILITNATDNSVKRITKITSNRVPVFVTIGINPPTGNTQQTVLAGSKISDLVVTGSNIQWYDASSNGNLLSDTTILANQSTYFASQTINGCESTDRLLIQAVFETPLATQNVVLENLKYYPNPTSGIINITNPKEISEISVSNLLGQTLLSKKPNTLETQIDLSKFSTATYFVKVISEGKSKIIKVVKQ